MITRVSFHPCVCSVRLSLVSRSLSRKNSSHSCQAFLLNTENKSRDYFHISITEKSPALFTSESLILVSRVLSPLRLWSVDCCQQNNGDLLTSEAEWQKCGIISCCLNSTVRVLCGSKRANFHNNLRKKRDGDIKTESLYYWSTENWSHDSEKCKNDLNKTQGLVRKAWKSHWTDFFFFSNIHMGSVWLNWVLFIFGHDSITLSPELEIKPRTALLLRSNCLQLSPHSQLPSVPIVSWDFRITGLLTLSDTTTLRSSN